MFCAKCGTKAIEAARFCASCGEDFPSTESIQVVAQSNPALTRKIAAIFGAVAVIVIAIVVFTFISRMRPLLTAQRSWSNFGTEITTRLQTTPFYAVELLAANLQDGTTTLSIDNRDNWSRTQADIRLMAESRTNTTALDLDLNIDGLRIDVELMANRNYMVARSSLLSNDFYGLTFSTFRDDFDIFGRHMGMTQSEINMVADIVESIETAQNANNITSLSSEFERYTNVISSFFRNSNHTSSSSGGETRIEFMFTDSDVIDLLTKLLDTFEEDENFVAAIDAIDPTMFRMLMREMRNAIRELEREIRGEITLVLYVGSRNRLNRMELDVDLRVFGDRLRFGIVLCLGQDVHDTWQIDISFLDNWSGTIERVTGIWDIRDGSNRYRHTLTFFQPGNRHESIVFESDWNTSNGNFTLSYNDNTSPWGGSNSIDGRLTTSDGGFRLQFDTEDRWSTTSIEIVSSNTSNIRFPSSFINVCEWNTRLMDDIERAVRDLIWGW